MQTQYNLRTRSAAVPCMPSSEDEDSDATVDEGMRPKSRHSHTGAKHSKRTREAGVPTTDSPPPVHMPDSTVSSIHSAGPPPAPFPDAPHSSTSKFRGVTRHCRTGRWEAHIWHQGRQLYLGGFQQEEQAALAYDVAALKLKGAHAQTNYNADNYSGQLEAFKTVTKEELISMLRRHSRAPGAKASSVYKGVTRHQKGRWEARIGQAGNKKYRYLGLYTTEVEAAQAYDREAIAAKGIEAQTNFHLSHYIHLLSPEQVDEAKALGLLDPADEQPPVEPPVMAPPTPTPPSAKSGRQTVAVRLQQLRATAGPQQQMPCSTHGNMQPHVTNVMAGYTSHAVCPAAGGDSITLGPAGPRGPEENGMFSYGSTTPEGIQRIRSDELADAFDYIMDCEELPAGTFGEPVDLETASWGAALPLQTDGADSTNGGTGCGLLPSCDVGRSVTLAAGLPAAVNSAGTGLDMITNDTHQDVPEVDGSSVGSRGNLKGGPLLHHPGGMLMVPVETLKPARASHTGSSSSSVAALPALHTDGVVKDGQTNQPQLCGNMEQALLPLGPGGALGPKARSATEDDVLMPTAVAAELSKGAAQEFLRGPSLKLFSSSTGIDLHACASIDMFPAYSGSIDDLGAAVEVAKSSVVHTLGSGTVPSMMELMMEGEEGGNWVHE